MPNDVALRVAPGMRIKLRSVEWLVKRTQTTGMRFHLIDAVGISDIVRDREMSFILEYEREGTVTILDPADVTLVPDRSPHYNQTLLYIESLLRSAAPSQSAVAVGTRAAIDPMPYQLEPARKALQATRPRILIADDVGLGKTIEAGILVSELIARGRGKRILVVTTKAMLTQFQKEFWIRFSIALTRLDSDVLQRVKERIPDRHNPFHYFDRVIISIDTLKNNKRFGTAIENATWDIIVIDEAQNVAERRHGTGKSQRARLAQQLTNRSDALLLLSATPHDGSKRSFASLMRMLSPLAIADPEDYGPEDIKGLFVRRFRHSEGGKPGSDQRDPGAGHPKTDGTGIHRRGGGVRVASKPEAQGRRIGEEVHAAVPHCAGEGPVLEPGRLPRVHRQPDCPSPKGTRSRQEHARFVP